MKFQVMSRYMAEHFVQQEHKEIYAVISISNTGGDAAMLCDLAVAHSGMLACLPQVFDDVYVGESYGIAMTESQAKEIVDFVRLYFDKVDFFIIHCEAGQSRSAGVAAALSKWINGDDWDYFLNPKFTPNSYCYQMVLEAAYQGTVPIDRKEILHKVTVNQNLDLDWNITYNPYGEPIHVGELKQ